MKIRSNSELDPTLSYCRHSSQRPRYVGWERLTLEECWSENGARVAIEWNAVEALQRGLRIRSPKSDSGNAYFERMRKGYIRSCRSSLKKRSPFSYRSVVLPSMWLYAQISQIDRSLDSTANYARSNTKSRKSNRTVFQWKLRKFEPWKGRKGRGLKIASFVAEK